MKLQVKDYKLKGEFPIIDQSQDYISGWSDEKDAVLKIKKPVVVFGDHTLAIKYIDQPFIQGADGIKIFETDDRLLPKFLYHYLKTEPIKSGGYKRHYSLLKKIKIPVPNIENQKNIINMFDTQEESVLNNHKLIDIFEDQIKEKMAEVL